MVEVDVWVLIRDSVLLTLLVIPAGVLLGRVFTDCRWAVRRLLAENRRRRVR